MELTLKIKMNECGITLGDMAKVDGVVVYKNKIEG